MTIRRSMKLIDLLNSYVPRLIEEYNTTSLDHLPYLRKNYYGQLVDRQNWRVGSIKMNKTYMPNAEKIFPVAYELCELYSEYCPCGCYSVLEPHEGVTPHTDTAPLLNNSLRIHMPLIFSNTGESSLTVDGKKYVHEIGKPIIFDNSLVHSAKNDTDDYRVVFIIDFTKDFLAGHSLEGFVS